MGLFDSLVGIATDVVEIAVAPVEIVVDIVAVPVKEIAEQAVVQRRIELNAPTRRVA